MRSREEALTLFQTGFMKPMAQEISSYVAPIFWGNRLSDCAAVDAKVNNGTIFFMKCGGQPLAITADHVYAEYLKRKESEPSLICQIWDLPFIPKARLIDSDSKQDIATFQIEETEVEQMGKKVHHASQWPPHPPEEKKGVFVLGFPGHIKKGN